MINHLKDMDTHFMIEQEMLDIAFNGWEEEIVITPEGEEYIESQILSEQDEESVKDFLGWLESTNGPT